MQRALPSKRKFGSMVSIGNAGGAVYLKTKIRGTFPRLHLMGKLSLAPPLASPLESKIFFMLA